MRSTNLPAPTSLLRSLGPSFILLGLALGSGELILWPYLVSRYGLGIIWGALLGITFQYFLNTEIMRYSLARGESVFLGWRKLSAILSLWFIFSSFVPWVLPGIAASSGELLEHLFPAIDARYFTIILLVSIGLILTIGKTLYYTMVKIQSTIILLTLPFIAFLVYRLASMADLQSLFMGLVGKGDGWNFFPPGVSIAAFMGAFAYSGAGGNLNLAQSYYIKEKGMGMGKYGSKISSLFAKGSKTVNLDGSLFSDTQANRSRWKKWWNLVLVEHGLVFWGLGLLTICLLAVLAYATTRGQVESSGLIFLYEQANIIGAQIHPIVSTLFIISGAIMLYSTQLGVFESIARIISENILLLGYKPGQKANPSLSFYVTLWLLIGLGIIYVLTGSREPRIILTIGALLNAAAMMVAFPLIYLLNTRSLPAYIRPSKLRGVIFFGATCFFAYFLIISLLEAIGGKL